MKSTNLMVVFGLLLVAATLTGCTGQVSQMAYGDPFDYCAAVGTADTPGLPYNGPAMPESVARGLQKAMNVPDTPLDILQQGSTWRCMDGQVYACFVGANLPCAAQGDTSQTPTQAEILYCQQNPDSDFIPAAVTGRETVYEWRCAAGSPEVVRQVSETDAQGFMADIWYPLSPE